MVIRLRAVTIITILAVGAIYPSFAQSPVAKADPYSYCGEGGGEHYSCSISISSSGSSNGILWYQDSYDGVLHALNATTLVEIYNSGVTSRDELGVFGSKFAAPTVANGKVYVGAANKVGIYGENPASVYWSGSANDLNCNGIGQASVTFTQNGPGSLSWNYRALNGPKLVYSMSWSLSDSRGQFGNGLVSGPEPGLMGAVYASRTPVGEVTVTGTLSFWITTGTCNAPYTIYTTGN